jgi:hypothetical protein
MDEEGLALILRKFNRLFKIKKGDFKNTISKFAEKPKGDSSGTTVGWTKREKNPRGIQCNECVGYGHIRAKCANLQGNVFNVTYSDESDKEDPKMGGNYLGFESPYESSNYATPNLHDSSENESEGEDDL